MAETSQEKTPFNDKVDKRKTKDDILLPSKYFVCRNSLLTDFFHSGSGKSLQNLAIAVTISTFLSEFALNILGNERSPIISLIQESFGKFDVVLKLWLIMFLTSCTCYLCFYFWVKFRNIITKELRDLLDVTFVCLLIFLAFTFVVFIITRDILRTNLSIACTLLVTLEQVRFLMKIYAFARTNIPKVISAKHHHKNLQTSFRNYLYFLFAPTLVYKDNYPQQKEREFGKILIYISELMGCIWLLGLAIHPLLHRLETFCVEKWTKKDVFIAIIRTVPSAYVVFLSVFYFLLHLWMNAWAEFLHFGDRLFYKDWWTSTSYKRYYRTWNVIVHDWLYSYVYKDIVEYVTPRPLIASNIVFLLSAIVHEYVIIISFKSFLPVMFTMFYVNSLISSFLSESKSKIWNVIFLLEMGLGNSVLIVLYTMEYKARALHPHDVEFTLDFFTPRLFTCDCIS